MHLCTSYQLFWRQLSPRYQRLQDLNGTHLKQKQSALVQQKTKKARSSLVNRNCVVLKEKYPTADLLKQWLPQLAFQSHFLYASPSLTLTHESRYLGMCDLYHTSHAPLPAVITWGIIEKIKISSSNLELSFNFFQVWENIPLFTLSIYNTH